MPWTPPFPQFTLSALKDDKVTDVMWLDAPPNENSQGYVQMRLPSAGMCYRQISAKDFHQLLKIVGASDWQLRADNQHDSRR